VAGWIWLLIGGFGGIGPIILTVRGEWDEAFRTAVPVAVLMFLGIWTIQKRLRNPFAFGTISIAVGALLLAVILASGKLTDADENLALRIGMAVVPALMILAGILAFLGSDRYRRPGGKRPPQVGSVTSTGNSPPRS
jgi:glycerol uptake facilitator-like aquaporin